MLGKDQIIFKYIYPGSQCQVRLRNFSNLSKGEKQAEVRHKHNIYRPFRNFLNDYVIVTCCHYGRICLSRERLGQAAVTSETDGPRDLKEAKFTEFVSSSY